MAGAIPTIPPTCLARKVFTGVPEKETRPTKAAYKCFHLSLIPPEKEEIGMGVGSKKEGERKKKRGEREYEKNS